MPASKEYKKLYYLQHRDHIRKLVKKHYEENKVARNAAARKWAAEHKERVKEIDKKSYHKHLGKKVAKARKRDQAKLKRMPSWLTKEQIKAIELMYVNRPEGYHVDHIVPLQGENVSGLHVPWNLQYLPARQNLVKSNRFYGEAA